MTSLPDRDARSASDPDDPLTGHLLGGRYRLGPRIGEGGMGVVYRAADELLNRTVAVKVFRDEAAEVARTAVETRMLASLNHASLVTLYDAQVGSATPRYLVMEYVDGPTLRERLVSGPLPEAVVETMARDLGVALHVVHEAGIVHRDIKPSNVLLRPSALPGEEFRVKLADFGIAYLLDTTRLTSPGTVIGSAAYLSPEQVTGAAPAPASDIYALGLLVLESLTGRRAFAQTGAFEAALARLSQDPSIPAEIGSGWAVLLSRMTAREPSRRPTALEVVTALDHLNDLGHTERSPALAVTGYAPVDDGEESRLAPGDSPTLVAPESLGAPTTTVAFPVTDITRARTPGGRRWIWICVVVILLVVAGIVIALIWSTTGAQPAAPVLPVIGEPLDEHLRQLLDSVSP